MAHLAASIIVIASMVVLLRLFVISQIVAYGTLPGLVVALYNWRKMTHATKLNIPETSNLAELRTAIGFGLLYVVVLLGAAWMQAIAGTQGLYGRSTIYLSTLNRNVRFPLLPPPTKQRDTYRRHCRLASFATDDPMPVYAPCCAV